MEVRLNANVLHPETFAAVLVILERRLRIDRFWSNLVERIRSHFVRNILSQSRKKLNNLTDKLMKRMKN